jgi:transposase
MRWTLGKHLPEQSFVFRAELGCCHWRSRNAAAHDRLFFADLINCLVFWISSFELRWRWRRLHPGLGLAVTFHDRGASLKNSTSSSTSVLSQLTLCEVARRRDVVAGQIYRWRRDLREAATGFTEVVVAAEPGIEPPIGAAAVEIEFGGDIHVRIAADVPAELARAVIKALAAR